LSELGIDPHNETSAKRSLIEVWNKIDCLGQAARERLANVAERRPANRPAVMVSAATGEGIDSFAAAIETRLAAGREIIELCLDPADGAAVSWVYRHTEVLSKSIDQDGRIAMTVRADASKAGMLRAKFSMRSAVREH
jgi:GTPase